MQNLEQNEQGPATATAPVTIITESRNLKAQPSTPGDNQLTTGKVWDEWLVEIKQEFRFFQITDPVDKKDALLIYGGKEISQLKTSQTDGWIECVRKIEEETQWLFHAKE